MNVAVPCFDRFAHVVGIGQHADSDQLARLLAKGGLKVINDISLE